MSQENLHHLSSNPQRNPQDEFIKQQEILQKIEHFKQQKLEEEKTRFEAMNRMLSQLKIPDAVKDLPQYSGSKNGLYNFIQNVEEILSICMDSCQHNPNYAKIIVRAIRNKIVGDANDALEMYNNDGSWEEIRDNLINHYADKRVETSLIRDLHKITQGYDSIEKYFSRVSDVLNSLNNWAKLNTPMDCNRDVLISAKRNWYHSMCLAVFLAGLGGSLGPMVRAMQPTNLQTARAYCLKEQNTSYLKMKPLENSKPIPRLPPKPQFNPFNSNLRQYNYQPFQRNPYHQPQYFNHRPFTQHNPAPPNRQLLPAKPQKFSKPEPMDTSSNLDKYRQPTYGQRPFHPQQPFQFQQREPPRFTSQELFNVENNPYEYQDYQDYSEQPNQICYTDVTYTDSQFMPKLEIPEQHPIQDVVQANYYPSLDTEIQDEDFHQEASTNQLDT